jgi:hypothetical protein
VQDSGTFKLEGNTDFRIEHELDDEGGLSIWFYGGLVVRPGDRFDGYLTHLEKLAEIANEADVARVHCHLEDLGEVLSRAQHAIYRMLHAIRAQGRPVTIYATAEQPEQSEHLRMSRLFVDGVSKQPGATVTLTEIQRAS